MQQRAPSSLQCYPFERVRASPLNSGAFRQLRQDVGRNMTRRIYQGKGLSALRTIECDGVPVLALAR
jgi:hypothetical protein